MAWARNPQSFLQAFIEAVELYVTKRIVRAVGVVPVSASNAVSLDCSKGDVFTYTVTENTTITPINVAPGQFLTLIFQATSSSRTITFGAPFKSTGTLATGTDATKTFTVSFVGDGTSYHEVARTAASA